MPAELKQHLWGNPEKNFEKPIPEKILIKFT